VLQGRAFKEATGLDGLVLAKLDGTAKGGVVFAIVDELEIPVLFVGMGEQLGDLSEFDAHAFVGALFKT
jgi:fused signal recognition particle receptor